MDNYIITIARGFGSGGKFIGTELSKRLNIPCYEREILTLASEESGLTESLFSKVDEKLNKGFFSKKLLNSVVPYVVEPQDKKFESDANLFNIQAKIIRELADTQSCIIIGKCADYILKDYSNVISFYIEAPRKTCVKSIVSKMGVTEKEANKLITKTDKYRADYYQFYTYGNYWTNPINYDFTINTERMGIEKSIESILELTKLKFDIEQN